ncbi:SNX15 protein, partial [Crocuta crocuta]
MSRQAKDDFLRHYTVSDPRTHPKGYTEYKVTAQFISKRDPEDVKEVVVWKRYSDFRKLHGDLAYTHRNLFRRLEEFPAFPRAQVFGEYWPRCLLSVDRGIQAADGGTGARFELRGQHRRPCSSCWEGGGTTRPRPPPPHGPGKALPQTQFSTEVIRPEILGIHYSHIPRFGAFLSLAWQSCCLGMGSGSWEREGQSGVSPPYLIVEGAGPSPTHVGELAAMEVESERLDQEPWEPGGQEEEEGPVPAYLSQATELITQALRDEKAGAYPAALQGYRDGVHILLQGVPGDPSSARREGVKKKAAEYLKRAEEILRLHLSQLPP